MRDTSCQTLKKCTTQSLCSKIKGFILIFPHLLLSQPHPAQKYNDSELHHEPGLDRHFRWSSKNCLLQPASLFINKINFDLWTQNSSPAKSFIEKSSRLKKLRKTSEIVHQKFIVVLQ